MSYINKNEIFYQKIFHSFHLKETSYILIYNEFYVLYLCCFILWSSSNKFIIWWNIHAINIFSMSQCCQNSIYRACVCNHWTHKITLSDRNNNLWYKKAFCLPLELILFDISHNLRHESWPTEAKNFVDMWEIATEPTGAVCLVADAMQDTLVVCLSISHTRILLSCKL